MFVKNINPLNHLKIESEVVNFTDDTVLHFSGTDWLMTDIKAEAGLKIIK